MGDRDGTVHRCLHCDTAAARRHGSTAGIEQPGMYGDADDYRRQSYGEKERDGLHTDSKNHAAGMPGRSGEKG